MTDLITWLRTQLDTDERTAQRAMRGPWYLGYIKAEDAWQLSGRSDPHGIARIRNNGVNEYTVRHIATHDPARVLRQVQAHRAILAAYDDALSRRQHYDRDGEEDWFRGQSVGYVEALEGTIKRLASIYSDRDGYDPDWSA